MKIYIEASSFYGNRSGVGRYSLMLTKELAKLRNGDEFTLFSFLRPGRTLKLEQEFTGNTRQKFIRWFPGRLFSMLMRNQISLPLELFGISRADIILYPNFISWSSIFNKTRICVVHDVAFLYYPEFIQRKNLVFLKAQLSKSLERSTKIIAVSEATKSDIVKHFHIKPEKIAVVYNAVDTRLFNTEAKYNTARTLKKLSLPEKYILYVGNIEPRKNLVGLLKAYQKSYPTHNLPLVVVGARGWNNETINHQFETLKKLPIYRTEFVDDNELASLYAGAEMFVYPSYYEGFGIPVIEAMASGCPVICSNTSSLPEVVGDAAIMVSPDDIRGISHEITRLANNPVLHGHLKKRGLERSELFTWQKSAEQLSVVIDKAVPSLKR